MSYVAFPTFVGYNGIAVWPRTGNRSQVYFISNYKNIHIIQIQSLFGLMDTQPIQSPIKSGEMTLPYYEGHYYVAYTNGNFTKKEVTILKKKKVHTCIVFLRMLLVSTSPLGQIIYSTTTITTTP